MIVGWIILVALIFMVIAHFKIINHVKKNDKKTLSKFQEAFPRFYPIYLHLFSTLRFSFVKSDKDTERIKFYKLIYKIGAMICVLSLIYLFVRDLIVQGFMI